MVSFLEIYFTQKWTLTGLNRPSSGSRQPKSSKSPGITSTCLRADCARGDSALGPRGKRVGSRQLHHRRGQGIRGFDFHRRGLLVHRPQNWHPFIPENTVSSAPSVGAAFSAALARYFSPTSALTRSLRGTRGTQSATRHADRNFGFLSICTVLYIVVSIVLTGVVNYTKLNVPHPSR